MSKRGKSSPGTKVFLTGFMGVGKTTVGSVLARLLGCEFVDTDAMIEASQGRKIAEIFAADGEAVFRGLEHRAISKLVEDPDPRVIGLGGGAIENTASRELVLKSGFLVWLRATPETILARVAREPGKRPLLEGLSDEEKLSKVRHLLATRQQAYGEAQIRVLTDGKTPEEVAKDVIGQLS